MKKPKGPLLLVLILIILTGSFPAMEVKADNTVNDRFYVGYEFYYTFQKIGEILKVTNSNKKIATITKTSDDELLVKAKSPGKTTLTIKGKAYTRKINLTVKKMDVTAKFCGKLPNGEHLVKVTNNTKEGFFESVRFAVVLRASNGDFLDYGSISVYSLLPGKSLYVKYMPEEDSGCDFSKSTLEVSSFETEALLSNITYTDCSSKLAVTDVKGGVLSPSDSEISVKFKNNSSEVAHIYFQICWYDEKGKIVDISNHFWGDLSAKETGKETIFVPDEDYSAASYRMSVVGYNKVYPKPTNEASYIPTF
ncbi:Ig-like domain-containing protein [Anaerocolumna xylanovorans]|uniref:Ig-like domain (Group 2) n=1 Tax=Anaerocolumna xylanovorans DSM 12503 TaxID=1121345 RepID=A0A1M7YMC6_9FIRM|nr:hypothetical protein [Anaerocolumna xylanovorans]SHO53811.1 hypothetical protein SAMN02745217_04297 [Anaerocolumna xylanovorans DSM 12503]